MVAAAEITSVQSNLAKGRITAGRTSASVTAFTFAVIRIWCKAKPHKNFPFCMDLESSTAHTSQTVFRSVYPLCSSHRCA